MAPLEAKEPCLDCDGTGRRKVPADPDAGPVALDSTDEPCLTCAGEGVVALTDEDPLGFDPYDDIYEDNLDLY